MMALPKTVFSIPNLTVSISGSSGKNLFIKMNYCWSKDYTIDHYKNIIRFVMLTKTDKKASIWGGAEEIRRVGYNLDDGI